MPFKKYIEDVGKKFARGNATEHSYRPPLETLLKAVLPPYVDVTNEPARIACGAPDYILSRKNIPVGYIEAKDIGNNLDKTEKGEQLKRYLQGLENLILTDYLEFRFYLNGEKVDRIRIAEVTSVGRIHPIQENFDKLKRLLTDFGTFDGQTIKSAKKLAQMMARKARLMRDVFKNVVQDASERSSLHDQFDAFKRVLVHDMDEDQFADVYAQTIAYGLFTARLHDKSLQDFSRQEAFDLIPKSNPFLRRLFGYVTGIDLDRRAVWIVDALCDVYRATDLRAILKDFGTATGRTDPILHFYETFLGEYDKKLKKARGVWYTPEPVVNFIVRAIDDVLKDHFGLKDGLADTSKVKIQVEKLGPGGKETGKKTVEREVHKVQLLDVATGTGTFLAEAVKQIYARFKGQEGLWSSYVENDILPRLHGFELLMASYAMCHMKLDLLLQETGYRPSDPNKPPRVGVYLTNSLEEHYPKLTDLFAGWLAKEANEASRIKKDLPIMVAFGNPPYAVSSANKGEWIQGLIADYKKDLNERKINLDDDYIKFIRYAEHYVEKNGQGIVAMITNNSFLDGVTHRQMRKHLLETFDDIYIYDLHGSTKKKEAAPDGSTDQNVFDIQQGVSISILIKHNKKSKKLADVYHFDSFGKRKDKYECLKANSLKSTPFAKLKYKEPYFFFVPRNYESEEEYKNYFPIPEIFPEYNSGIQTKRDNVTIAFTSTQSQQTLNDFIQLESEELRIKYHLPKDGRDWKIEWAKNDLLKHNPQQSLINYRPFDNRFTYYTGNSKGFQAYPRHKTMRNILNEDNHLLLFCRQLSIQSWTHVFCCDEITDLNSVSINSKEQTYCAPLYVYQENMGERIKSPNLDPKIYSQIKEIVPDATPESLFDYIYAVLYSPEYRKRYAEFLKSEFPRIPCPKNTKAFHALTECGAQLRELHLMESERLDDLITTYPIDGDHEVTKLAYNDGEVWINERQYFGGVPRVAWEFYIGGYQPAQKWLKDRKGRKLSIGDLRHWQRIIVALTETDRIMREIDAIDFLPKGKK